MVGVSNFSLLDITSNYIIILLSLPIHQRYKLTWCSRLRALYLSEHLFSSFLSSQLWQLPRACYSLEYHFGVIKIYRQVKNLVRYKVTLIFLILKTICSTDLFLFLFCNLNIYEENHLVPNQCMWYLIRLAKSL